MKPGVEKLLAEATREQLVEGLLSACQELAHCQRGINISWDGTHEVEGGTLNNQVLCHLGHPDTVFED